MTTGAAMTKTTSFPMALAALAYGTKSESAKSASADGLYAKVRLSAMCTPLHGVWYAGTQGSAVVAVRPRRPAQDAAFARSGRSTS
jgi:hypothetical protein